VIAEIRGTEELRKRTELLELVKKFSELKLSPEIEEIAKGYVNRKVIPQAHFPNALHIALASFYKIDFLIITPMELIEGGEEDV
jgi:hypothetical protein